MRGILQVITLIFLTVHVSGQDCYIESKDMLRNDFSGIWIGETFQGTIGKNNQRIEIRFISVSKVNDKTYSVIGKSKVNSNICDFTGKILIQKSMKLDEKNLDCEDPDYSFGFLSGNYELNENETQSHVGQFLGDFRTMYDKTSTGFVVNSDWYGQEGVSEFIGEWKDYKKDTPKYCSWGIQIPPTKRNDLFKHYDNEFYIFNSKYIDNGWRTYVLAHQGSFIGVPKDFESDKTRQSEGFMTFDKQDIEESRKKEKIIWWK
ncbi:hypothetical protein Q4Q35_07405 [Flavivirga aquimarina]|uniref:Uncharacterized protein n=1 Tax=Flavivirga aquimarina TaxID=2027862 RepID=A0ABT8W922_9FLAO|nr:hypothetical protein [Flavivirga aquimarina]MDO5969629.1 hypothetical protein [Flavivirga aquimarina]